MIYKIHGSEQQKKGNVVQQTSGKKNHSRYIFVNNILGIHALILVATGKYPSLEEFWLSVCAV